MTDRRAYWAAVATLTLGAVLRLIFLDIHGLDGDDAFSIALAAGPIRSLLESFGGITVDIHPKLYYLLLNMWGGLTGYNHISMKLFSALCDILTGALLIHAMPRRLAPTVGLLWATNPLLIAVASHVRMYTLVALCAVAAVTALMRATRGGHPLWWAAAAGAALAAAYTHITGVIIIGGVGLAALYGVARRRDRGALVGVGGFAAAGLLYLPYVLNVWQLRTGDTALGGGATADPLVFVPLFAQSLLVHRLPLPLWVGWGVAAALVLIAGVMAQGAARHTLTVLIVFVAGWAGAAYFAFSQDVFLPKYTAFNVPLMVLLVAWGIHRLPAAALRGLAVLGVVGLHTAGLVVGADVTQRPDFPAVAAFIEQHGDPNDAIIVFTNYGAPPFRYYYDGAAPIISPLDGLPPPERPVETFFPLPPADTAWLVLHHIDLADPTNRIESGFTQRYPLRTEVYPTGAAVKAYDLRPVTPALPPEATPLDLSYGGQVRLRGYQVYTESVSRRDQRLHPPSGWVHVTLYWEAAGVPFEPVVRIEGEGGAVFGLPIERPTGTLQMHPPGTWQAGEVWRTDVELNLNPTMPPGPYKIVVRVLGPEGALLLLNGQQRDWHILETITVTP